MCQICCHTYHGNECIICVQNSDFNRSLKVDLNNLLSSNITEISQQFLDIPESGFPSESVQDIDVRPPTIDELREIRVANFTEKKEVSINLKRMTIKKWSDQGVSRHQSKSICKTFVINLCYNKYVQTLPKINKGTTLIKNARKFVDLCM